MMLTILVANPVTGTAKEDMVKGENRITVFLQIKGIDSKSKTDQLF